MDNIPVSQCDVCEMHHSEQWNVFDLITNILLQIDSYDSNPEVEKHTVIKGMRDNMHVLFTSLLTTHMNVHTAMNAVPIQ
jgi:hypothetical protein